VVILRGLYRRGKGGTFIVRKAIPADVRHAFGGTREWKRSLKTDSQIEAIQLAAPLLAEFAELVRTARREGRRVPLKAAAQGCEALRRWKVQAMAAPSPRWNPPLGDVDYLAALDTPEPWADWVTTRTGQTIHGIGEEFYAVDLCDALAEVGVRADPTSPVVRALFPAFAPVLKAVMQTIADREQAAVDEFVRRGGAVSEFLIGIGQALGPKSAPQRDLTLNELFDRYLAVEPRAEIETQTYGWRRLAEALGDIPITQVTPDKMEGFKADFRRFPNTRRPDIQAMTFPEIISRYSGTVGFKPIAEKSVWKYFVYYNRVFEYAASMGLIPFNPVTAVMPKKPKAGDPKRLPYNPDQIAAMFEADVHRLQRLGARLSDQTRRRGAPRRIVLAADPRALDGRAA
jgi:hypothetical protein